MKKSIYEEAKMDVIRFDNEDIITDSTEEGGEVGGGGKFSRRLCVYIIKIIYQ